MNKIQSLNDLLKIKQALENKLDLREKSNNPDNYIQIKVAMSTCGIAAGAREVMNIFLDKIVADKIPAILTQSGCMKYCHAEPVVEVHKPGKKSIVFGYVTTQKAVEIVDKYIKNDELIDNVLSIDNTSITNTKL